jgi:N-acetylmuramoyl-L-alanine amidase
MSSLAHQYGFRDWRTIYRDPLNADLRKLRPDPNLLAPGDSIAIDRKTKTEDVPTTRRHVFRTLSSTTKLRIKLHEMAPKRYALAVDGEAVAQPFPANGLIEHIIVPTASSAALTLWFTDEEAEEGLVWLLDIGSLVPVALVEGVKQRLNNLGCGAGEENAIVDDQTTAAIATFQSLADAPQTGVLDDQLREQLRHTHDDP